jgi:hypothetical protein
MRLLALLLVVWTATAHANLDACVAEADRLRASGQLTPTQRAERVRDCNNAANDRDAFSDEFWAYYVYMASEFEAGRISQQQALYLIAQKQSEMDGKRRAAAMQMLPYAAQPQQNQYRSFRSPPTPTTNCSRDPWGNVSCTTR